MAGLQFLRYLSVATSLFIGIWLPVQLYYFPLSIELEIAQDLFVAAVSGVNLFLAFHGREDKWKSPRSWLRVGIILDIIAFLPLSLLLLTPLHVSAAWLGVTNLLTARHVGRIRSILDEFDNLSPIIYRLAPIVCVMPILVHLMAMSWIALGSGSAGPNPDSLLEYTKAIYWSFSTLTTVGYGDIVPKSPPQMLFACCVQITGVGVFGYVLSNVASLMSRMDAAREHHMDNVDHVEDFMQTNHIPRAMRTRVRSYFHYLWKTHKGYQNRALVAELPRKLQSELLSHINRSMVERVSFLKAASPDLMEDILRELKPRIFVPGEKIFRFGEQGEAMYFIHSGQVDILGGDQSRITVLNDGDFFGETALVRDQPRNATAIAISYCDTYVLYKNSFKMVLAVHTEFLEHMKTVSQSRSKDEAA